MSETNLSWRGQWPVSLSVWVARPAEVGKDKRGAAWSSVLEQARIPYYLFSPAGSRWIRTSSG